MRGNAKVQVQVDKKRGTTRHLLYIPSEIVKVLKIKKGNRIDFDIGNPFPDNVEAPKIGLNFKNEKVKQKKQEEKVKEKEIHLSDLAGPKEEPEFKLPEEQEI